MLALLRARGVISAVVLLLLLAWSATPAHAGDKKTGKIDLEASLLPADLGGGGSGLLVIKGTLLEHHHIFAKGKQAMKFEPLEAAGVTYDLDSVKLSDSHVWTDEMGDANDVWEGEFEFRVKVTLAKDLAAGTKVGMAFSYWGCIENVGCYPEIKGHRAYVVLADAPGQGALGNAGAAPAGPAVVAAKPRIQGPPPTQDSQVKLEVDEAKGLAKLTFTPSFGWHLYGPGHDGPNPKIQVEPVEAKGVTWGKFKMPPGDHIERDYVVTVPFERAAGVNVIKIRAKWGACTSGIGSMCATPQDEILSATWAKAGGTPVAQPDVEPPVEAPKGEILFEVVEDDDLGADDSVLIWKILLIFLGGVGLAFTPCVLPIIPITVSVISGGNTDIPRKRLAALLGTYVMGLALTFATMGVVAAMTGGAMSALFAMPGVQWGLAVLFLVLSFGMFGVYELQPPAFLMKLQGGAQKRSGSFVGAFLFGCLGAVIASPCTGPAIAGLLVETSKSGSVSLGFLMFFVLGLGTGSVVFAVGALNFAARPGPWMVWVRYAFGIMLVAVSFYYLRNYQLIGEPLMWVFAVVVFLLVAGGIAWHLNKKEGEEIGRARVRGVKVGVLTLLGITFIALYTRVPSNLLSWTYAKSPEHLQQLVADSNAEGKPVVVDFWGDWCTNCKVYDKRIAADPKLRQRFERITRLKVDLSEETVRWDMRHALGVESSGAPVMVFIDREGRIWRKADLVGLADAETIIEHIDTVLR